MERDTQYHEETITKSIANSLKKQKMQAFVKVETVDEIEEGYKRLIVSHGIGPLTHNTVLIPHQGSIPEIAEIAYRAGKNIIVLREELSETKQDFRIDIWWDSIHRKTSELMLVLAHMFQTNMGVKHTQITLKSIVNSETAREQRLEYFRDFFANSRFHVDFKVYVASIEEELKTINFFSSESDLAFIGLPIPGEGIQSMYATYIKHLKSIKNVALVVAAEPVDFQEIFK